jgi:hypothetical protein
MHRYQVITKTTCCVCFPKRERIITDSEIQAKDEVAAKDSFLQKHKLCPFCLEAGTKAAVDFDTLVNVEMLPGF